MHQVKTCNKHGEVLHHKVKDSTIKAGYRYRCKKCMSEYVVTRQRKVKSILVKEAGGCCQICGYDKYQGALQFHHLDPATKEFALQSGVTKALDKMRKEAAKCLLLCANCHAEIEGGIISI